MRYAVLADLHGRRKSWRRVRAAAAAAGVDRMVILGDYLEAEVPWRRHDPTRRHDPDTVVKHDPELWQALASEAELVLGNQEWRIRDLLRPDQVPASLAPLLAAPERTTLGTATGIHGHQLRWHEPPSRERAGRPSTGLEPDPTTLPPAERLLFAGHSHHAQVIEVTWVHAAGGPRPESLRPIPAPPGKPMDVSPFSEPLRPEDVPGRWSTLFVNLGPAVGKPSHWLVYDDTRQEITFQEAPSTKDSIRDKRSSPGQET